MYNKSINYIIEKMRGDSLTPLGLGNRNNIEEFALGIVPRICTADFPDVKAMAFESKLKITEYLKKDLPFFKGKWKLDEKGTYKAVVGNSTLKLYFFVYASASPLEGHVWLSIDNTLAYSRDFNETVMFIPDITLPEVHGRWNKIFGIYGVSWEKGF